MYTLDEEEKVYERNKTMNEPTHDESNEDIDTKMDIHSSSGPKRD